MVVTLIGYRGCGKSTVAPLLAQRLGWKCVDADDEIESRAGKSIRHIFAEDGEPVFRALETEVLGDLLQQNLVIAAGGGAVLADVNRRNMRSAGPVVWLQASAETLAARIAGDPASAQRRPSLTGKSIAEEVADVLTARNSAYTEAATLTVDAENTSPEQIADLVYHHVSKLLTENPS